MAQYDELTRLLRELLTNRFSPKPRYVRGVLGDGLGNVVVPDRPDKSYARFSKNSTTYFEIFNRTVNPVNNWPILIGELPWQPGLTQVVDTDWSAFEQAGWGDTLGNTSPHAPTHEWPDGSPGSDAVDVHLRAIVPGRAFISDTAPTVIYVNSFEYGTTGTLWAGLPGVDLQPMMSATVTGTMRYAGVYVDESTNSLGIVTGGTTVYTSALEPPRVSFPETGVIPIARVRVYGGQTGLVEADIKDARRLFDTGGGDPNAIPQSLLNAKGDLITATAADTPTILTVGTDGYVLTADSGEATGIKWAAAGGWPFDALKVISPTNASAEATTVQGAFDTGDALDVFLVDPGTYVETITANKLISIVGGEAARCIIRGTTSDTPVINATAAALFKELTVTNEAGGTTAACVNVSTSLVSPQFYNLRVSKSLGGGTTGVGFDISAGTGIWIENCRINISNGTNRYGIRVTGTATFTVTVVGGSISATTADVLVNNSNATVRLWGPVLTGGGLSVSAGTVTGWWYDSSGGLHIIGGGWPYNDVHNVGGNARLATVETALNDAAVGAGDVVELGQDSTEDAVGLDKAVTVQGVSREFVLTVNDSANGLNISANDARAENLNVVNTTTAATTYGVYCNATGIVLERVSALVAAGGTTRYGIAVPSSMDATLRDCTGEGTGGGGTNIGLVVDGTAYVYGGEYTGDDYSLAIGAAGTVSLYGPRLNGAIFNSGTITDDSWWFDADGNLRLAGDVYPEFNNFPLFARLVNYGFTPDEHWLDNTDDIAWTGWAAYTGTGGGISFGTPGIISISNNIYRVANAGAIRAFRYRAAATGAAIAIRSRLSISYLCSAGLQIDDGVDATDGFGANNFYRVYITQASIGAGWQAVEEYRTGGGGVTTNTAALEVPTSQFIGIGILTYGTRWSSWNAAPFLFAEGGGYNTYAYGFAVPATFTPARVGLYWVGSAVDGNRVGLYDWYDEATS